MELFGYIHGGTLEAPSKLSEVSIVCTIEDIDTIINFLIQKREELISWAKSYENIIDIKDGDYTEQQLPNENDDRIIFIIDLKELIEKYKK